MKTLKTILAWIDWSTYCKSNEGGWRTDYEFPKSICPLFWRTLFSIISLPITWVSHIWNLLFVRGAFAREDFKSHKLNLLNTTVGTFALLFLGVVMFKFTDGNDGYGLDWFHASDPLILNYFKALLSGILMGVIVAVFLSILIGAGWCIWFLFTSVRDMVVGSKRDDEGRVIVKSNERVINKTIDAIKNKYCPKIDWSYIREKQ